MYKLTVVSDPAQAGTFTYNPPLCSSKTYGSGTIVTVTATPSAGFAFANWSGDIADNAPVDATIRITMDKAKNLTAHFVPLYAVQVSVSPKSGGTLLITTEEGSYSTSGNQTTLSVACALGSTVQLSAIPASGYKFERWSGNLTAYQGNESEGDLTLSNITLVVNSPGVITAEFSQNGPWDWVVGGIASLLLVSLGSVIVFGSGARKPEGVSSLPDTTKEAETTPVADTSALAESEPESPPGHRCVGRQVLAPCRVSARPLSGSLPHSTSHFR